jgi:hypothetical protein
LGSPNGVHLIEVLLYIVIVGCSFMILPAGTKMYKQMKEITCFCWPSRQKKYQSNYADTSKKFLYYYQTKNKKIHNILLLLIVTKN